MSKYTVMDSTAANGPTEYSGTSGQASSFLGTSIRSRSFAPEEQMNTGMYSTASGPTEYSGTCSQASSFLGTSSFAPEFEEQAASSMGIVMDPGIANGPIEYSETGGQARDVVSGVSVFEGVAECIEGLKAKYGYQYEDNDLQLEYTPASESEYSEEEDYRREELAGRDGQDLRNYGREYRDNEHHENDGYGQEYQEQELEEEPHQQQEQENQEQAHEEQAHEEQAHEEQAHQEQEDYQEQEEFQDYEQEQDWLQEQGWLQEHHEEEQENLHEQEQNDDDHITIHSIGSYDSGNHQFDGPIYTFSTRSPTVLSLSSGESLETTFSSRTVTYGTAQMRRFTKVQVGDVHRFHHEVGRSQRTAGEQPTESFYSGRSDGNGVIITSKKSKVRILKNKALGRLGSGCRKIEKKVIAVVRGAKKFTRVGKAVASRIVRRI
ncbi:hypothetical protein RUND412_005031 [Rhizina undulata]